MSTDPASNVGQVFSQTIGHRITDITALENLAAMEVDPMAAAQAYRDRVLDPARGLMPTDVVSSFQVHVPPKSLHLMSLTALQSEEPVGIDLLEHMAK